MKMGFGNNIDRFFVITAITIAFATFACEFAGLRINLTDEPSVPASGAACLSGIFPGKTTRNEVVALLGNPLASDQVGGFETMHYASPVYGQFNSISLLNGTVALVSIVQGEDSPPSWSAVKVQYGEPAYTAYDNYVQGSMAYAFPARGFAFVADEELDVVFIQQCFVPMSQENYMIAYGNFLPIEDPFIR